MRFRTSFISLKNSIVRNIERLRLTIAVQLMRPFTVNFAYQNILAMMTLYYLKFADKYRRMSSSLSIPMFLKRNT
jgi:hypothetical protein